MKLLKIALNSKSMNLVKSIIKAEDLEVTVSIKEDAIGDTNIVIKGATEEINLLNQLYKLAA